MAAIAHTIRRASEWVEDFRGDYGRLASMMEASWAQSPTPPYIFTAEYLADCFRYPGASFSLAPTIYRGSDPVAFAVGHPRRVTVDGIERRLLVCTLLTVAAEQRSSGYGIVVWSELMRRAAQAGFDGVVNYCVLGEAMDRMIDPVCRRLGLPVLRVPPFSYLAKSMWVPDSAPAPAAPAPSPSVEDLLTAAVERSAHAELARRWSEDEAAWELSRHGAVAVKAPSDGRAAVLTGYLMSVADAVRTRCLVVQEVLWGDLAGDQDRLSLVRSLMARGVAAGARIASVPDLGIADMRPFLAAGFVPTDHGANAYLSIWSEPVPGRPPRGWYLDVF